MKLLLLDGHPSMEYEEFRLFSDLGFDVFSPFGCLINPERPVVCKDLAQGGVAGDPDWRRPLRRPRSDFSRNVALYERAAMRGSLDPWGQPQRLPAEFFSGFDVVVVHFCMDWLDNFWEHIRDKVVVWRGNGQGDEGLEAALRRYEDKIHVIRSSPREGKGTVIRMHLYPEDWEGWTGEEKQIIAVGRKAKRLGAVRNWDECDYVTSPFPRKLYGTENEDVPYAVGKVSMAEVQQAYRSSRAFFALNARPSPLTMAFEEAWMTGTPVVCLGKKRGGDRFEPPELIVNGESGFVSDDLNVLRGYVSDLMKDKRLAESVSVQGRKKALELFSVHSVLPQWRDLLLEDGRKSPPPPPPTSPAVKPKILVASLFQDSVTRGDVPRYFDQWSSCDYPRDRLRFCLIEGDSSDNTYAELAKGIARLGVTGTLVKHDLGKKTLGSTVHPERFLMVSALANHSLEYMADADYLLWIESDLYWNSDLLNRLLAVDAGVAAPIPKIQGTEQFYDTWGFRRGKEQHNAVREVYGPGCFDWEPPWHPCVDLKRPFEVDTAGTCLLIKKEVLEAGARFTEEEAIVGLCKLAGAKGFKIMVDPEAVLWHRGPAR